MNNYDKAIQLIDRLQMLSQIDKENLSTHAQRNACQHLQRVLLDELSQIVRYHLQDRAASKSNYENVENIPF